MYVEANPSPPRVPFIRVGLHTYMHVDAGRVKRRQDRYSRRWTVLHARELRSLSASYLIV